MKSLVLCALLALPAVAAEQAAPKAASGWTGVRRWLENLKQGLSESAVSAHQRRMRGSVAVAAVRGAGQSVDDPNKPYWKGSAESKRAAAAKKERAELSAAVDLALAGKNDDALQALDAFEKAHPQSTLLGDCRDAREKIKSAASEPAAAPAAEPKAEPASATTSKP